MKTIKKTTISLMFLITLALVSCSKKMDSVLPTPTPTPKSSLTIDSEKKVVLPMDEKGTITVKVTSNREFQCAIASKSSDKWITPLVPAGTNYPKGKGVEVKFNFDANNSIGDRSALLLFKNSDMEQYTDTVYVSQSYVAHIYVKTAGTLAAEIAQRGINLLTIKKLVLTGSLNGADVLTLRQMSGIGKNYNEYTKGQLEYLDISKIRFVPSNNVYFVDRGNQEYTLKNPNMLPDCMFLRCGALKTIKIPASIKSIGASVFTGSNITNVNIPEGIALIGASAFMYCPKLTNLVLPKSISYIESSVFSYCSSLTSINIPEGVTFIEDNTFRNCNLLKSVTLPVSLKIIGNNAFFSTALTSVHIPQYVTTIKDRAFGLCKSLNKVTIDVVDPKTVTLSNTGFQSSNDATLYVPTRSVYLYMGDATWGTVFRERIKPQP